MMDTLCCTIRRVEPVRLTPPVKACLMEDITAKRIKATTMESSVSAVRSFFRFMLLQMR